MSSILDPILNKLEGDAGLLRFKEQTSGIPLWPLVRHPILFHLLFSRRNFVSVGEGHLASLKEKIQSVIFSVVRNPFLLAFRKKRIIVFNSGITNIKDGDKYFNRLADYFYSVFPNDTALVEETSYGKHSLPRIHSSVYSSLFVRLSAKIISPFFKRRHMREQFEEMFAMILDKLKGEDLDPRFFEDLKNSTSAKFHLIHAEYVLYRMLFKYAQPKMILVEDAAYGSHVHLILAAKQQGIAVAEYQHGFINSLHLAYNYGQAVLSDSSYRAYLPEFYLGYGNYWLQSINMPVKKYSVGNPHLTEAIAKVTVTRVAKRILVLGGGAESHYIISLMLDLKKRYAAKGYQLALRPHPLEWAKSDQIYKDLIAENIEVDRHPNMYESIRKAEIVIGELSTAIYEAKSLADYVFITQNKYSQTFGDESYGIFHTLEEGLQTDFRPLSKVEKSSDFLWQPGWRDNYRAFVEGILRD